MLSVFHLIGAGVAGIDLWLKSGAERLPDDRKDRELAGGRVIYRKVHNHGMILNRLDDHPELVKGCSVGALAGVLLWQIYLKRQPGRFIEKLGTALLAGGAVSNTADRLCRGYVVDYIAFRTKWEKMNKITFNLGDFAIFAGLLLLIVQQFFCAAADCSAG